MLTFYPTISYGELGKYATAVPRMLLPVSSWAGARLKQQEQKGQSMAQVVGAIPVPTIPAYTQEIVADCGGFVATKKWGDYRYSRDQYVTWLDALGPKLSWAATMDFCCENEVTSGNTGIVQQRQDATTEFAYAFWQHHRTKQWTWVPTVQGWLVEDYVRHVRRLKPLIGVMAAYYRRRDGLLSQFRVGIGTLCNRASVALIHEVVAAVTMLLPGVPLHLWGVKLGLLQSALPLSPSIRSIDSGAWNGMFSHGRDRWKNDRKSDGGQYTQREWCFRVALPQYEARIQAALLRHDRHTGEQEGWGA